MRLALLALASAAMTIATVVYLTHRRQPASAPLYREDDEGVQPWDCRATTATSAMPTVDSTPYQVAEWVLRTR